MISVIVRKAEAKAALKRVQVEYSGAWMVPCATPGAVAICLSGVHEGQIYDAYADLHRLVKGG